MLFLVIDFMKGALREQGFTSTNRLQNELVYCSENLDDLFALMRERGYQIKNGKYIAVKPTFAECFVRLKTLGAAYLPNNLEKRIAERKENYIDNLIKAQTERSHSSFHR